MASGLRQEAILLPELHGVRVALAGGELLEVRRGLSEDSGDSVRQDQKAVRLLYHPPITWVLKFVFLGTSKTVVVVFSFPPDGLALTPQKGGVTPQEKTRPMSTLLIWPMVMVGSLDWNHSNGY